MRTLYFQCDMGAAGDMLSAALLELQPDPAAALDKLNQLGVPGVVFSAEKITRCGIAGTRMIVKVHGQEEGAEHPNHEHSRETAAHHGAEHTHAHHHAHHTLTDVEHIVSHLKVSEKIRKNILGVYTLIAQAESRVHGCPVPEIHFHEVGTLDAVADVTAFCFLLDQLAPQTIVASPVHVGSGHVHCAHGVLPVPAPATALLLEGIPSYGGTVQGELCTPTGAALLKYFIHQFDDQPCMCTEKIGYGCGSKNFERANCVRAFLGETRESPRKVLELRCNLDDMTPEAIGFATEMLLKAGALDVYTIPIGMKKNRPGILLTCMCQAEQRNEMIGLLFRYTTTLGIREFPCRRYTLERRTETRQTEYGQIRIKKASGWGVQREKAEFEDLAQMAREHNLSLWEAEKSATKE